MLTEEQFVQKVLSLGGEAYIVGGWVRDRCLGRIAHDKDFVICGLSKETFEGAFSATPVGKQFPVYLLQIDGLSREVALARTERKTGYGYHGFEAAFTPDTSIEEDLFRRDTRMNSMAVRLSDGEIIDPFGGRDDIQKHLVSATSFHFRDDPVRALRAARQAAQLGFTVADDTISLMRDCAAELAFEPTERIFNEMQKALLSDRPSIFFVTLRDASLLSSTFPELEALSGVEQPVQYHQGYDAFEHTMIVLDRTASLSHSEVTRFAALVHDLGKGLTPREQWPHHYGHEILGLSALHSMNQRMTMPKQWFRFASFIISHHMDIPRTKKAGKILKFLLEMQKYNFTPAEIGIVITADHDRVPHWLYDADDLLGLIDKERQNIVFPDHLPSAQRGNWLNMILANKLAERIKRL